MFLFFVSDELWTVTAEPVGPARIDSTRGRGDNPAVRTVVAHQQRIKQLLGGGGDGDEVREALRTLLGL